MAARLRNRMGTLVGGFLASLAAGAQPPDADGSAAPALRRTQGMIVLDYQVVPVKGDQPIDLMGLHVYNQLAEGWWLGAGLLAPVLRGQYGGFTAYDIGVHAQRHLTGGLFATAGLSAGGGAGGRSVENAKAVSGTGGFFKLQAGLGWDFGSVAVGAGVSRLKFSGAAIGGTQANVFVEVPYSYLTGPFDRGGQRLSLAEARQAAPAVDEQMLTVVFDNFRQRRPEGSYKGSFSIADLQYAHYLASDTYWFAALGVGYRGLPLYNQVLGGLGQRLPISPAITLYGQIGIGSGGYAPERINTDAGLVVYPRVSAEYALSKDLGLSLSAGYLVAPKGTSKNTSVGLALTRHLRAGLAPSAAATVSDADAPSFQAYRVSLFQQTETGVRFSGIDRGRLQMIGVQVDAPVSDRFYVPVQAAVAYNRYLGYPGYGELLAGIGLQTLAAPGERLQVHGELMGGTNVHGLAVKASGGLRYGYSDRVAMHAAIGRIEARSAAGNRFLANSLTLGLDYRFSMPTW